MSAVGARKLTYDWHREIKTQTSLAPICRIKGDLAEKFHVGYIQIERGLQKFCTGSSYEGKHDSLGFAGFGTYLYPHGAKYEGYFKDGQFHGEGTITYPKGQQIDGIWNNGKLVRHTFKFSDGLEYTRPWKYCQLPDRSFRIEVTDGLKAAGEEFLTNEQPPKDIPDHCYDTGDGYFDPITKCVYNSEHQIMRVSTVLEEKATKEQFRQAADTPIEYRPDLYEYWTSGRKEEQDEILATEECKSDTISSECLPTSSETIYSFHG